MPNLSGIMHRRKPTSSFTSKSRTARIGSLSSLCSPNTRSMVKQTPPRDRARSSYARGSVECYSPTLRRSRPATLTARGLIPSYGVTPKSRPSPQYAMPLRCARLPEFESKFRKIKKAPGKIAATESWFSPIRLAKEPVDNDDASMWRWLDVLLVASRRPGTGGCLGQTNPMGPTDRVVPFATYLPSQRELYLLKVRAERELLAPLGIFRVF